MNDDNGRSELQGVAGWLGLLVVVLGVLSPARMLFQTFANIRETVLLGQMLGPNTSTYIHFSWGLLAVSMVGSIFLAYRLLAVHRWSSVGIVVTGLWCLALLPTLLDAIMASILFPKFAGAMIPEAIWTGAKSGISAMLWTAYLIKSKRVANTYVKEADESEHIVG